ncbi:hypothetical protein [Longirhabdus pacifica]|uniref:hypothetical protein n=1 Tax=Longirhabdus pacifica TaxID=2305227 RepID=UPI001008BDBB|nr:hypothetical protein [Longirhabdus pacifica]
MKKWLVIAAVIVLFAAGYYVYEDAKWTFEEEKEDVLQKQKEGYVKESDMFEIQVSISSSKDEGLHYSLDLDNAKERMYDVELSMALHQSIVERFYFYSISKFTSTLMGDWDVDIVPRELKQGDEAPGMVVGTSFGLSELTVDDVFLEDYKKVYVKVTWDSEDGETQYAYMNLIANTDQEVEDFLIASLKE